MDPDPALRANRLALLSALQRALWWHCGSLAAAWLIDNNNNKRRELQG